MLAFLPYLQVPDIRLIVSLPFIVAGCWFEIRGVKATTLKISETHRTERIVTEDVYLIVRRPPILRRIAFTRGDYVSSVYVLHSLLFTPLPVFLIYLFSKKRTR